MSNADDQFANVVDALMRPAPPPPSTVTRVADLYPADGRLGNAAQNAGFDVVYQIEPKNSQEIFDFADVPPFDVVTANMPDGDNERADALEFVLRFLRVRRPETFLMMGMGWNTNGRVFTGPSPRQNRAAWLHRNQDRDRQRDPTWLHRRGH